MLVGQFPKLFGNHSTWVPRNLIIIFKEIHKDAGPHHCCHVSADEAHFETRSDFGRMDHAGCPSGLLVRSRSRIPWLLPC